MNNAFFYLTKSERIGVVLLLLLCATLFIVPRWLPDRSVQPEADFSELKANIAKWEAEIGDTTHANAEYGYSAGRVRQPASRFHPNRATYELLEAAGVSPKARRSWLAYLKKGGQFRSWKDVEKFRSLTDADLAALRPLLYFDVPDSNGKVASSTAPKSIALEPFDPNTVSAEVLEQMGVPAKTARNWAKLLASGARFRRAEDVRKIYGMTDEDYARIAPYIQMGEPLAQAADAPLPQAYGNKDRNANIDINQATAEQWQQLPGIGPAFSKRIIAYREKLGGFHSVEQVAETYGLPDSVFQSIYLQLRPSPVLRTIPINQVSIEELAAHPYVNKLDAKLLVNYRKQHGNYSNIDAIGNLYGLEPGFMEKVGPYLRFD